MSIGEFLVVFVACAATIVVCRVLPIFLLKGRSLPENVQRLLNLIPPATFAALIANDLFKPENIGGDPWLVAAPLVAAALVFVVGIKTKSLVWCIVVGVAGYAAIAVLAGTLV